jgi:choline dehydrogenase-like flavoprotein
VSGGGPSGNAIVEIENVNREFAFLYNMKYGLGGSGAVWSAAAWRYTPEDFKTKSL